MAIVNLLLRGEGVISRQLSVFSKSKEKEEEIFTTEDTERQEQQRKKGVNSIPFPARRLTAGDYRGANKIFRIERGIIKGNGKITQELAKAKGEQHGSRLVQDASAR